MVDSFQAAFHICCISVYSHWFYIQACIYTYIHINTYKFTHTNVQAHRQNYMYTHTYIKTQCIYIYTNTQVKTHTPVYLMHINACKYTSPNTDISTYMKTEK